MIWIAPGGGLEPGETHEAAALRELREEVGHASGQLGPCVWIRRHEFDFQGTHYRQTERFFLARSEHFEVDTSGMDDLELELVQGHRWWSVDEITAARSAAFAPKALGSLLRPLLLGEIPPEPIQIGA